MVSVLNSETSSLGSSLGRRHYNKLYSWARHLTLTVLLSIQVYMYKWIPANLMLGAKHTTNKHPIQGE